MKIFDESTKDVLELISEEEIKRSSSDIGAWPVAEKNTFLMDRETAVELGGYPKESINLIIGSSSMSKLIEDCEKLKNKGVKPGGCYLIGDCDFNGDEHISFGKVVLIEAENLSDDDMYSFTQEMLLADSRLHLEDVMQRQSPSHYTLNLKVGKKAVTNGFNIEIMARTISEHFKSKAGASDATVFLIANESELYKKLLPHAEKVKEITLTMNHIFDGIDMDCGTCVMSPICDEVDGLRQLHKNKFEK